LLKDPEGTLLKNAPSRRQKGRGRDIEKGEKENFKVSGSLGGGKTEKGGGRKTGKGRARFCQSTGGCEGWSLISFLGGSDEK